MKYVLRLLALIPVFCLLVISHSFHVFRRTWYFLRYGGEFIHFEPKSVTILDTYVKVCELVKNQEDLKEVAKYPAFMLKKVSQGDRSRISVV